MNSSTVKTRRAPAQRPPERAVPRVRRNNAEDAEAMRRRIVQATLELFHAGGLDAVSMRSVAERIGISPMTPYRYFADKADMLSAVWEQTIGELLAVIESAVGGRRTPRTRLVAFYDAYFRFCQERPDALRIAFDTMGSASVRERPGPNQSPVYRALLDFVAGLYAALAEELGADPRRVVPARDICFAMQVGFVHATMINTRYPWGEQEPLRAEYIGHLLATAVRSLQGAAGLDAAAPAVRSTARPRA